MSDPDDLAYLTPAGKRRTAALRIGPELAAAPRALLRRHAVLLDRTRRGLLVRPVDDRPQALDLLTAQVAVALRLHQEFTGTPGAELFPDPIGYDLDAAEPYAVYHYPRGRPVAALAGSSLTDQRIIARDLVRAVHLLETLRLVHHGITPDTVHWDNRAVQLWGLEWVAHLGHPRRGGGPAPYAAPQVRLGQGDAEPADALWSCAQVLYRLVTGRDGEADRAPADLAEYRLLEQTLGPAFAPRAADRPRPAELLRLLDPAAAEPVRVGEHLGPDRAGFDRALAARRDRAAPSPAGSEPGPVRCPVCLEPIAFDEEKLFGTDARNQYVRLDPAALADAVDRQDQLDAARQRCRANPAFEEHYIPVPYLTNGRPLTVAMVGETSAGKTNLLTQIIGEITDGRLGPHGIDWRPVNREQTARFARERIAPLRSGAVLDHTGRVRDQVDFVEALLLTDARGRTRPVAFFDLGGEDLTRTDSLLRFLLGVDALIFVVDPVLALPFPQLDEVREETGVRLQPNGDVAFATVLNRLPREDGRLAVPGAVVLAKADLLRLEAPVDRWLGELPAAPLSAARLRAESRDVYALLHRHAGQAWLRPFDALARCTLHVASATGGRPLAGRFPRPVRAQRVLEPLLSLLAMHGMVEPGDGPAEEVGR
ncbi:hypothetical protein ACFW1A_22585 [Kitasatospora sp. NPDC058965]|uniref:hypothetical protein n=1 Tax=Kitasatospora sp. NPDC058965 TaxID=3346682 RepID=UPI003683AA51